MLHTSCVVRNLRGPAPKKRPMIPGSKIESADFYLSSSGYRILFKNEFLLFQFCFKPKISSRKLFPSDSSKIRPKVSPRKKKVVQKSLSLRKIIKTLHSVEEESLLMQYHSMNIEKLPKRIKNFKTLHSKLNGALELFLK